MVPPPLPDVLRTDLAVVAEFGNPPKGAGSMVKAAQGPNYIIFTLNVTFL